MNIFPPLSIKVISMGMTQQSYSPSPIAGESSNRRGHLPQQRIQLH